MAMYNPHHPRGCIKNLYLKPLGVTPIINIGVGAHITATALGDPRFDPNLSNEERKSPDKGVFGFVRTVPNLLTTIFVNGAQEQN